MSLKTEKQVEAEGEQGFIRRESNPYLQNTWAYDAWSRGFSRAKERSQIKFEFTESQVREWAQIEEACGCDIAAGLGDLEAIAIMQKTLAVEGDCT